MYKEIFLPSEAYLEGMKTREAVFVLEGIASSEAYLEGMKTKRIIRFLFFSY